MSFRTGDKSRENRIRKARQKMREKVRALKQQPEASAAKKTSAAKQ